MSSVSLVSGIARRQSSSKLSMLNSVRKMSWQRTQLWVFAKPSPVQSHRIEVKRHGGWSNKGSRSKFSEVQKENYKRKLIAAIPVPNPKRISPSKLD